MTSRYDVWATAAPEEEPARVYITRQGDTFSVETNLIYESVLVVLLDMDMPQEQTVLAIPSQYNGLEPLYNIRLYKEEGKFTAEADSIDELEVFVNGEPVDVAEMDKTMIRDEELLSTNG